MPYPLTQVGRATTRLWHHIRRWKKIRSVRSHGSKNRAGTLCGWSWKPIDQSDLQRLYRD